ncbi:lipoyl(octanoyl) transferase LipB [Risungbinella massiliensis]|uniref:lipoyl(octanoyl) transferase LipB n=1 Tax=Risungbinella massiliensis TaxID=1329796 RepID=UPI0005CC6AAE|nr:lipoyl(octanoyl) transferase LipB [Risungbinella massiliensis]
MFQVYDLGTNVPYKQTWEEQRQRVKQIDEGLAESQLWLLEHSHTVTMGRGTEAQNVLFSAEQYEQQGIQLVEVDRGGDVTYHGPGQLVGYPLFYLGNREKGNDARQYLRDLEESLILALSKWGIQGTRKEAYTGVWVGEEKIAAIGVKFHRARHQKGYITSHGFALNLRTDLRYFQTIVPCGIQEYGVTSLAKVLDREMDNHEIDRMKKEMESAMREVFSDLYASCSSK